MHERTTVHETEGKEKNVPEAKHMIETRKTHARERESERKKLHPSGKGNGGWRWGWSRVREGQRRGSGGQQRRGAGKAPVGCQSVGWERASKSRRPRKRGSEQAAPAKRNKGESTTL